MEESVIEELESLSAIFMNEVTVERHPGDVAATVTYPLGTGILQLLVNGKCLFSCCARNYNTQLYFHCIGQNFFWQK